MWHPERRHNRDHFFKYMSCETARAVLKNRSLKWSPASTFNDPFDVQFDLHFAFDADELVRTCVAQAKDIWLQQRPFDPKGFCGKSLSFLQSKGPNLSTARVEEYLESLFREAVREMLPEAIAMM